MLNNNIYFARTYDFSNMGVATGHALDPVRFNVAYIPFVHYELCVIVNGISSHVMNFYRRSPMMTRNPQSELIEEIYIAREHKTDRSNSEEDLILILIQLSSKLK